MNYNQNVINYIGEDRIRQYLTNGVTFSYENMSESNLEIKNAVENYILKYINTPHNSDELTAMRKYITNVAKQFRKNNTIISNSIFFSKDNLKKIYGKAPWFEKLKKVETEFTRSAHNLYNKSIKEELNDAKKTQLMAYFNSRKNTNNEQVQNAMEEYATRLLAKNEIPSNTEELKFIMNYASRYVLTNPSKEMDTFPEIYISAMTEKDKDGHIVPDTNTGGYYSYGQIFINTNASKQYWPDLASYIQTVCHESQHAIQDYKAEKNPDSVVALEWAEWRLFRKYYNDNKDSVYRYNYNNVEIEIDAQNKGFDKAKFLYSMLAQSKFASENKKQSIRNYSDVIRDRKKEWEIKAATQYEYAKTLDGKHIPKEVFNVEQLNKIIKEHPEELKNYPSLNKLYHEDGTLRSFEEMITSDIFINQSESSKVFEDYLIYAIQKEDALEKLKFSTLNALPIEKQANIFKHIINLFDREKENLLSYTELNQNKNISDDQIRATSNYHMKIATKLSDFIDNNYYFISQLTKEGKHIGHASYNSHRYKNDLESIIYRFANNQNPVFQEIINKNIDNFKQKYNRVISANNLINVQDKLNQFDEDTLRMEVALPNGVKISLRQYAEEYITSRINSNHHFVTETGQEMKVMDAINDAITKAKQEEILKKQKEQDELLTSFNALSEAWQGKISMEEADNQLSDDIDTKYNDSKTSNDDAKTQSAEETNESKVPVLESGDRINLNEISADLDDMQKQITTYQKGQELEQQSQEIDSSFDNYTMFEQSINQNPNLTDEEKAQIFQQLGQEFNGDLKQNLETTGRSK